jgi:hypothetical protein
LATASNPVYAKNTTAAAVSTPAMPNADGATPNSTCDSGRASPDCPLGGRLRRRYERHQVRRPRVGASPRG